MNLKAIVISACLAMLTACGGSSNGGATPTVNTTSSPQTNNNGRAITEYSVDVAGKLFYDSSYTSSITSIDYPIHIYLPPGYDDSDKSYPILYTTDAQWNFEGYAQMTEQAGIEAIVVGIEQGPEGRRAKDFLPPGVYDYYDFLTTELLPYIEGIYRVDSEDRTLVGASFGGSLISFILFLEDPSSPFYHNYMAFDGSYWGDQDVLQELREKREAISLNFNAKLILSGATINGNNAYVKDFYQSLIESNYPGLAVDFTSYDLTHNAVTGPSFDDALDKVFKPVNRSE